MASLDAQNGEDEYKGVDAAHAASPGAGARQSAERKSAAAREGRLQARHRCKGRSRSRRLVCLEQLL